MEFRTNLQARLAMLVAAAFGGVVFLASPARATLLAPGSGPTVTPGTATLPISAPIATVTLPFTGLDAQLNVHFTGTLVERVYPADAGNSLGGLYFAYQITNDLTSPDALHAVTISSYSNFLTDVDYVSGGGTAYVTANRKSAGVGSGIALSYVDTGSNVGIAPGTTSDWIVVKTNASLPDDLGGTAIIDGGNANLTTLEPQPGSGLPTPEPASLGLLALGGLILLRKRR